MKQRMSRSGELLCSVVNHGEMTRSAIESELAVTATDMDQLLDGSRVMSLAHQLCLATLVIERFPRLARQGHALRGQAGAALAFNARETPTHASPPERWNGGARR